MTALIVGFVVLVLLFAWSLCVVASDSESERDRLHDVATMREQRAERVALVDEQIAEARDNGGAA